MPRRRQQQRSSLAGLARWLVLGLLAAGLGSAIVCIRNQQVAKGDCKKELEREIRQLEKDIEVLDTRLAQVMDRENLVLRLHMQQSDLVSIDGHERIIDRVYVGGAPESFSVDNTLDHVRETPYTPRH
ncbi:MAG: hypothetical protein AAGA58_05305 [Verrucomicrobiota bacterium]